MEDYRGQHFGSYRLDRLAYPGWGGRCDLYGSCMAPEQLLRKPHPASDQYALGAVVYERLTGTPPFRGFPLEIAMQHLETPPPPLRRMGGSVTPAVEQVVLRALEKNRHTRFASVQAFAQALREAS